MNGELNSAGYCRECISRATSLSFTDFEKLAAAGIIPAAGLEDRFQNVVGGSIDIYDQYIGMKLDLAKAEEEAKSRPQ